MNHDANQYIDERAYRAANETEPGTLAATREALRKILEPIAAAEMQTSSDTQVASPAVVPDLEAEAVLDPRITFATSDAPLMPVAQPRAVFLTGASGFLGAFVLQALCQQTQAQVYCLVRAPDSATGRKKLRASLEHYGAWQPAMQSRIVPVPGDLAQSRLGLESGQYDMLAEAVDHIYHCAATVSYAQPYTALRHVNVRGTQEILRLAGHHRTKPLHYVSTFGVFESLLFLQPSITESDEPIASAMPTVGYTQSKWVAERLVRLAQARGLPACIYRPPLISGHSQTGHFTPTDLLWKLVQGSLKLGLLPSFPAADLIVSPVDYVAQALVFLARHPDTAREGCTFHLFNPHPPLRWEGFCAWLGETGYAIRPVDYQEWRLALVRSVNTTHDQDLLMLSSVIGEMNTFFEALARAAQLADFRCDATTRALTDAELVCPPPEQLLPMYFAHFVEREFMPAPVRR